MSNDVEREGIIMAYTYHDRDYLLNYLIGFEDKDINIYVCRRICEVTNNGDFQDGFSDK